MKSYTVKRSDKPVNLSAGWDSEVWGSANIAGVEFGFPDANSDHTPDVQIKMLYDGKRICGLFRVEDRYVVARAEKDQDQVCRDSCVEFFVKPAGSEFYFNFELNCGGTLLLYRCKDITTGDYVELPVEDLATVERYHTLPARIEEEISEPVTWYLGFAIPVELFEKYAGSVPEKAGWTANFTKCADRSSHPTWLSWMPLSKLSFHLPDEFGNLIFE
ncbi:MAG: diguanylate cyclase [Lentisphaerae bacterium]|nr:diguanylate cyclase [Lentisphaerota bacterium]